MLHADLNIRIDRNGVWYYQDSPIGRKEMVCLFASVLTRDTAGGYWLVTPAELVPIQVEDAPFIAVELFTAGCGRERTVSLRTNTDEIVTVDKDHPLTVLNTAATEEPAPYVALRQGIQAKLARPVYYELVSLGVEEHVHGEHMFGIWSSGTFFPMGSLEEGA